MFIRIRWHVYFLFLCILSKQEILSLFNYNTPTQVKVESEVKLPNLIGIHNKLIAGIIKNLSKELSQEDLKKSSSEFESRAFSNRLMLYGPPGNGKTALAKDIARASKCEFLPLDGPSIVGSFAGQGASTINSFFNNLAIAIEITGRPVVVFIDEIDALAADLKSEYTKEHKNALQQLWLRLDELKYDPRVFFICATNVKDKLEKAFASRFNGSTLEIKNPDAQMREKILRYYSDKFKFYIDNKTIDQLVSRSDSLSIRSLEDFIRSASVSQEAEERILTEKELFAQLQQIKDDLKNNTSDKKDEGFPRRDIYDKIHAASSILSSINILMGWFGKIPPGSF